VGKLLLLSTPFKINKLHNINDEVVFVFFFFL
jgi:hypothetical protein